MRKAMYLATWLLHSLYGAVQTTVVNPVTDSAGDKREWPIHLTITKEDTFHLRDGAACQVYSMRTLNQADSAIYILEPTVCQSRESRDHIPILEISSDCGRTPDYYALEHCTGWDMGYIPLPPRPGIIPSGKTLESKFAIKITADTRSEFHLHFIQPDCIDVLKKYKENFRTWMDSLKVECYRVKLPG